MNFFKNYFFLLIMLLIQFIKLNTQGITSIINGNSNNGINTYYITLYFGEQKNSKTFLMDTSGSLTSYKCNLDSSNNEKDIIKCQNNSACNNYPYSSCVDNKCQFEYNYYNSMSKGIYTNQSISFSGNGQSHIFPIGCIKSETNDYLSKSSDGILGLKMNDNSFLEYTLFCLFTDILELICLLFFSFELLLFNFNFFEFLNSDISELSLSL